MTTTHLFLCHMIHVGTGGKEASLFTQEMFIMYQRLVFISLAFELQSLKLLMKGIVTFSYMFSYTRFAAYKKWKFEVLNISKSDNSGLKVNFEFFNRGRHFLKCSI